MTKKAKTKLTFLADFLAKKVKPKWFNLFVWGDPGFPRKECGTTACAAGWATICFPRSGLSLKSSEAEKILTLQYKRRGKENLKDVEAAAAFFDISEKAAEYIFSPTFYIAGKRTKRFVIARIRQLVKTEQYSEYSERRWNTKTQGYDTTVIPVPEWRES